MSSSPPSGLNLNTVYQFQINSICASGTVGNSNIYELIIYTPQTVTTTVVAGVISVNQSPLQTVTVIDYRLVNSSSVVIQNISATGPAPNASFTTVASGTYTVQYRYGAIVNGTTLYSDDSSQLGAWSTTGTITV